MKTQTAKQVLESYYTAMNEKDLPGLAKYLHPQVQFLSPLAQFEGKGAVVAAIEGLLEAFSKIEIRAVMEEGNRATIVFDMFCHEPIGKLRSVTLATIEDGLIVDLELFFDARPFTL